MKAILKVSLLTTVMLLITACGDLDLMGNKGKFYYSNPTENTISFKVDGKDYQVEPSQYGSVSLASGEHTLEDDAGHVTKFMVFEHNSGGILNPNQGVYYTFSEVYTEQGKYKGYQPTSRNVTIYGHELSLPIKSSNAVVIDGNLFRCTYPIGKALPGAENKQYKQEDIKSKCFDQSELIEYFANEHDQNLVPNSPQNEENNSISQHLSYQIPQVAFRDPQVQSVANEIIALTETLKNANKVDIHQDLNKQYHQLTVQLVETYTESPSSHVAEEYIKLDGFIKEINKLRNYGVWVR
ncbi:hypothetical protein GKR48_07315 [Providencia sp. wls1943]|uniref:hypothetical protein n=1 Tax=Providencia sp. wls1943 TaxID=2675150 RepID=UPI0012B5B4F9|nr:hypothetical protein [Providencia sp. wls1943]MTB66634.1 hypothetical protein [Providencia sp. wls1943]